MGRLDNKTAVITGATSGIGEAVAKMFAAEGAKIIVTGRNEDKGNALVREITEGGGEAAFIACDLRKKDSIAALKDFAYAQYDKIDILFNNAGVLVHKPFLEQNDEDFDLIMETNYRAYVWTMQAFLPEMLKNESGNIINTASISSIWPESGATFYGAMKAAVTNISRNIAKEHVRDGIRVNCICPGPIMTNMTPAGFDEEKAAEAGLLAMGHIGKPDDIAYAAVYLASDETAFMTGQNIIVDGGVCVSN